MGKKRFDRRIDSFFIRTPTKRNDILNEKLQAAENRRKALEQSMLTKLSQHNRTVVTIREAW